MYREGIQARMFHFQMSSLRMAVRTFSSSSSVAQMVRPPISVFGIEGRYASALFSAASKENQLQNVERDMVLMGQVMEKNREAAEMLQSPIVTKHEKKQMLQRLAQEHKISPLSLNTLAAMSENGRLGLIHKFLKTFAQIMSAERGEVQVTVTTAKPLDASQGKALEAALAKFSTKGQTMRIEAKVDPTIIGGMIVSIGDKYVDMSTASKIKMYSKIIEETV
ncbi:hypothetical protein RvY_00947 [Ramazzottius varieornatus]|uniref:Oligomycin sensitivity conferral protein n=1 Tax=Ramazzottius varieornatus TaxID=947166 RepID=A0A1D1UIK7_RAMVA|nr:hypothetical protein RvY_00947 [Ramazzottius varieornatus]